MLDEPAADDVYVYTNQHNPMYMYIFRYDSANGWVQEQKIKGPGLVPDTPAIINSSGFKEIERTKWMLYAGIVGVIVGAIGSGVTIYMNN